MKMAEFMHNPVLVVVELTAYMDKMFPAFAALLEVFNVGNSLEMRTHLCQSLRYGGMDGVISTGACTCSGLSD